MDSAFASSGTATLVDLSRVEDLSGKTIMEAA